MYVTKGSVVSCMRFLYDFLIVYCVVFVMCCVQYKLCMCMLARYVAPPQSRLIVTFCRIFIFTENSYGMGYLLETFHFLRLASSCYLTNLNLIVIAFSKLIRHFTQFVSVK